MGAAVTPSMSAARGGELNPNTYFADWRDGGPALWKAVNDDKVIAAKKGAPGPDGLPVLEMVPDRTKGWAALAYKVPARDAGILPGDTILFEVEVRADAGVPMDLLLRLMAPGQKNPAADLRLPYTGEGVWRTLRMAITIPAGELDTLDVAIRLCGAKDGATASVRRASLMLVPPV